MKGNGRCERSAVGAGNIKARRPFFTDNFESPGSLKDNPLTFTNTLTCSPSNPLKMTSKNKSGMFTKHG